MPGSPLRMTLPTQLVRRTFRDHPSKERYGAEICASTGLPSGTVHPILARLQSARWLKRRQEKADPAKLGRPLRRYYRLNPAKVAVVQAALDKAAASAEALNPPAPRTRRARPRGEH